jgi:hypothetical protein
LDSHISGITQVEGIGEQDAEEDVLNYKGGSNRILENIKYINRIFVI